MRSPVRDLSISAAGTSLFNVSYQGTQTEVPFIAVQQLGNKRSGLINGFGFYQLKQHHNEDVRQFITDLLHNLVTWSAAESDDQRLRVEPEQQVFDGNDMVKLSGFLRNESGERESGAAIDITLSADEIGSKQFTMKNEGNGRYSLTLGTLAEGIYKFKAIAKKEGRTIDSYQGEFSVAPTRIEYVNTTRNDPLLQQIANQSGGAFYDFSQVNTLWSDMQEAGLMDQKKVRETSNYYPYRHIFWFILVVLLLGAEWLLRKYYALP
jgi:hypothetical protein